MKIMQAKIEEIVKDYEPTRLDVLKGDKETLKSKLSMYGKTYKGDYEQQKVKFLRYLDKQEHSEIDKAVSKINQIMKAEDFDELTVNVQWHKTSTWGHNPKATGSNGVTSTCSGCGYDKESTVLSDILNSDKRILKLLYQYKNDNGIDKTNEDLLGYGSGYGILPYFEDGVGVSCFYGILDKVGLKLKKLIKTKTADVYHITRKA